MPTVKKEGLASVLTLDAKQVLEAMRNLVEAQRAQADRDDWNAFQERKKKRLEAEKEKDNAYYWNIFQERKRESLEAAIDGMYVSTQKKRRLEAEIESAAMKEVDALRQKREKKKKNEKMKLASSCEEVWISKKVAIDESQLVQLCDERFATSLGSVFSCNKGHNKYGRTFHTIEQCYHCKHNIWRSHLAGMQCVSMQDAETYMHDAIHASEDTPLKLGNAIWLFKGFYYTVEGIYTDDEFRLLGIHLRRDNLSSIAYSEELISSTISATL